MKIKKDWLKTNPFLFGASVHNDTRKKTVQNLVFTGVGKHISPYNLIIKGIGDAVNIFFR